MFGKKKESKREKKAEKKEKRKAKRRDGSYETGLDGLFGFSTFHDDNDDD